MRHYIDQVLNPSSQVPAAGVQVAVYPHGSGTLATIYADAGITVKANPLTTDSTGSYDFYVADGRYDINISGANIIPKTLSDVSIFDASGSSATVVNAADLAGATADVQLNACIAAVIAAGGGECDARGLSGNQTLAAQVNVGNSSFVAVTLRLAQSVTYSVTITDGLSCGFKLFSNSSITGEGAGGNSKAIVQAQASTNADSLLCTDPAPAGGGSYIRATGITAYNPNGGTLVNGAWHIQKLFDNSSFERVKAANYNGIGFNIKGGCCGTTFANLTSDGGYGAGAQPVVVGVSNTSGLNTAGFLNLSADHPGLGLNNILIQGGPFTQGLRFSGVTYMEPNLTDTTTPLIQITNSVRSVAFDTIRAGGIPAGGTTACVIDVASTTRGFSYEQLNLGLFSCAINDHVKGYNPAGLATQSVLQHYGFGDTPNVFGNGIAMQNVLFANLGTPVNGTFLYCSDCTIANPCNSGGTGALAKRLNGAWVCS